MLSLVELVFVDYSFKIMSLYVGSLHILLLYYFRMKQLLVWVLQKSNFLEKKYARTEVSEQREMRS